MDNVGKFRYHHTCEDTELGWADLLGRIVVEKIIDLFTGGAPAVFLLRANSGAVGSYRQYKRMRGVWLKNNA